MNYNQEHITEGNIIAYLTDREVEAEVKSSLESWLALPENKTEAQRIYRLWEISALGNTTPVNMERAYKNVSSKAGIRREAKTRSLKPWYTVAAAAIALLLISIFLYNQDTEVKTLAIAGQDKEFSLEDNTKVKLEEKSLLTYQPEKFLQAERRTELSGTARFRVTHDPEHPFTVYTEDAIVTVLGTVFTVQANTGSPTSVQVEEGKVQVKYLSTDQVLILEGKQQTVYNRQDKKMRVGSMAAAGLTPLEFNGSALGVVIETLEKRFNRKIVVSDTALLNCELNATFSSGSLETILEVISATLELEQEVTEEQILLKGNGCF